MEIKISYNGEDLESFFKEAAVQEKVLRAKGFNNRMTGVIGITIFEEENPTNTIDIFIESETKALEP